MYRLMLKLLILKEAYSPVNSLITGAMERASDKTSVMTSQCKSQELCICSQSENRKHGHKNIKTWKGEFFIMTLWWRIVIFWQCKNAKLEHASDFNSFLGFWRDQLHFLYSLVSLLTSHLCQLAEYFFSGSCLFRMPHVFS